MFGGPPPKISADEAASNRKACDTNCANPRNWVPQVRSSVSTFVGIVLLLQTVPLAYEFLREQF
eukprot:jgi/Hompol1/1608/HPOL_001666-RA